MSTAFSVGRVTAVELLVVRLHVVTRFSGEIDPIVEVVVLLDKAGLSMIGSSESELSIDTSVVVVVEATVRDTGMLEEPLATANE
jgi:hypothetical protein